MTHSPVMAALAAVTFAAPAIAAQSEDPGGMLRTMPRGSYECALPGDAGGAAYRPVARQSFRILSASRYDSPDGAGTYILRGRELAFTRGPKKGERFDRVGSNQLRQLDGSGEPTEMLCTRG